MHVAQHLPLRLTRLVSRNRCPLIEMRQTFVEDILQLTGDSELQNVTTIQSLWSGYGECIRFYSPRYARWLVAKVVNPPPLSQTHHPRGWHGSESHRRKCRSYEIEGYFYQSLQPLLPQHVTSPTCYGFAQHSSEHFVLILNDLTQCGFNVEVQTANLAQCRAVMLWLAAFHAHYITPKSTPKNPNVWPRGTYWHLATRQREWQVMEESKLKQHATTLDLLIENCPYQTLVHGDAKLANFIYSHDGKAVAGFDFQYLGYGIGVQDVAYFIGSALSNRDIERHTEQLLEVYFTALAAALSEKHMSASDITLLCQVWRDYYCVACADFCRFLSGWSPQHKKLDRALYAQSELALVRYC